MRIDENQVKLFAIDISEEIDDLDKVSVDNVNDYKPLFLKRRRMLVEPYKDIRRSMASKAGWRHAGYSHLSGIRAFAKSVEGKRFHRNLANFILRKGYTIGKGSKLESVDSRKEVIDRFESAELAKLLSSYKTHLLIELESYKSFTEEVDFFIIVEDVFKFLDESISSLLKTIFNYTDFEITENFYDGLVRLLDFDGIVNCISINNSNITDIKTKVNKIKENVLNKYKIEEDSEFYYSILLYEMKKFFDIKNETGTTGDVVNERVK